VLSNVSAAFSDGVRDVHAAQQIKKTIEIRRMVFFTVYRNE
jgi:hypothetical protein